MLESWKRKESVLALYWGMTDFTKRDLVRSEFQGEKTTSLVDGQGMG